MNGPAPDSERDASSKAITATLVLVVSLIAMNVMLILMFNDGVFTYAIDDPYIHLALAENLAQGTYGVNAGEHSSPSSSILWPILLAPFAKLSLAPLLINAVLALLVVGVFAKVCVGALRDERFGVDPLEATLLLVAMVVATNLIGLVFVGMEHVVQLLFVSLTAVGLLRVARGAEVSWWLPLVVALSPGWRFENVLISGIAVLFLFSMGHRRAALVGMVGAGALFLTFAVALLSLGLSPLPTSVAMKISAGGDHAVSADESLLRIFYTMTTVPGILLITLATLLAYVGLTAQHKGSRWLALLSCLALVGHVLSGKYGWLNRYEIYMIAFGVIMALNLVLRPLVLQRLGDPAGRGRRLGVLAIFVLSLAWSGPYIMGVGQIPLAARNIYLQQYQMQRFLKEVHQGPVAVNDLGLVSYGYDPYVLDLWGLASAEAAYLRRTSDSPDWMHELVSRHDIELVMLYESWFPEVPGEWELLGELVMDSYKVSVAYKNVRFYATSRESAHKLRRQLQEFSATLPPRAQLDLVE